MTRQTEFPRRNQRIKALKSRERGKPDRLGQWADQKRVSYVTDTCINVAKQFAFKVHMQNDDERNRYRNEIDREANDR